MKDKEEFKKKLKESNGESTDRSNRWDMSIFIALMAVLISIISAFISHKESGILMEQQKLLSEQKEASVWPYLDNGPINFFESENEVSYRYEIENKGIGPAIIDGVQYEFEGKPISAWELEDVLKTKYPNLSIRQTQNSTLQNAVLAPGDTHTVITEQISKDPKDTTNLQEVVNHIGQVFVLKYCYCSVYGKCWKVSHWLKTNRSEDCVLRNDIR